MQEILSVSEFKEIIDSEDTINNNISKDPTTLALKGISATICTQIKYLQRAEKKLPTYYRNRAIIPSLSFEQSSSEATASVKDFGSGDVAIDLTCGLGVDSMYMSHSFNRVISIERDQVLSSVAKVNFERLGRINIEVVNNDALSFLSSLDGSLTADLIYIDPARRDNTKKVFLLEDCSPNMADIMPLASKISKKIVVKLSPLFDVDAAYNFFHKWGSCSLESVSYGGECKELIVTVIPNLSTNEIEKNSVNVVKSVGKSSRYQFDNIQHDSISSEPLSEYKYLYIPDVAFYKSRTVNQLMSGVYGCSQYLFATQNSPVFSNVLIENFEGSSYQIESVHPYKPKEIRKLLKQYNSRAKVLIKEFRFSTAQIKKELHIKDAQAPIILLHSTNLYFLSEL